MRITSKMLSLALLASVAAPSVVIGILAQGAVAYADQYPASLPANKVVSQTMGTGSGEAYPVFANESTPMMSERLMADNGGENYPTFANPTNGGKRADYAAIGTINGGDQYASVIGINRYGG